MKKSFISWRIGFTRLPGKEKIKSTAALLAPIEKVARPDDFGQIAREHGIHDILFIGPGLERTAGEIALDVLLRAHRLGRGWSMTWPHSQPSSRQGMTGAEAALSAMPESMEGFSGALNASFPFAVIEMEDMESASFKIAVIEREDEKKPEAPAPAEPPGKAPVPEPGPLALEVNTSLGKLLISHLSTRWKWNVRESVHQLLGLGFEQTGEEYGELYFKGRDGARLRVATEGDRVIWVEFILHDFKDPHLLDEMDFQKKQAEFENLFELAVHYAKALLGRPVFKGASGEKGFPGDQWADLAAVWTEGDRRVMVQQKHNDKELPLELCLVFAP